MPNTLISVFVSNPATEPVEAPHPNTGVYVTGTQATVGGPWTVVHTLITKTTTPLTMVGRLKNFPLVTVSVVASGGPNAGNIFNNSQPAPSGLSASGTAATTTISVTASSGANATAYRFFSATAQAGPYALLATQASATYNHSVPTANTTVWYQMQYVGGGYYDDSPISAAFSGTSGAKPFQLAMLTDSRGAYPGDTGTVTTSSVWALAQARLTSGSTYTGTIVHHGYPGATPANLVDPAYTNSNTYVTAKTAGQSAVQYLVSQLDPTKTPIIIISAGANGGTAADIKAIHDALRAAVPGALTIVDPILNRLDSPTYASGIPNRAAINASLAAGVGVYAQDTVQSFNTPQIYADDAPSNGTYFWNPDTITGLAKVHLTTAGNQFQGESYAQAYARLLGLTLSSLTTGANAPTLVSTGILQTSAVMRYSGGGWTNFSPNIQYISGYGGASASDLATFGFAANCYGWRLVSPTSNIAGAVKAVETGATIATGTEYSVDAPTAAGPPVVIMSKYYGTALAVHSVDVLHNATATGTFLFANLLQFCDSAGNFPAIPAAGVPSVLINWVSSDAGATFANYVASRDATAANWMVGFSGQTFPAPTGTQKVRLDLGDLVTTASALPAMIMGFGPAAAALSTNPRYNGIPRSWYRAKGGNAEVFEGGTGHTGVYTAATGGRLYIDIYADHTEFWMDGVLKTADTITAPNTGTLQVFLALQDSGSTCTNARYVLP